MMSYLIHWGYFKLWTFLDAWGERYENGACYRNFSSTNSLDMKFDRLGTPPP